MKTNPRILALLSTGLLLAACVTTPEAIKNAPDNNPDLADVRSTPAKYAGRSVRWGGKITKVENREQDTWVHIVEHNLDRTGEPDDSDKTQGRFAAKITGFLDPEIYRKDRLMTVSGKIHGQLKDTVGEKPYKLMVVNVDTHHLWREVRKDPYPDPFYYHRWYYRYPYIHYPHRFSHHPHHFNWGFHYW